MKGECVLLADEILGGQGQDFRDAGAGGPQQLEEDAPIELILVGHEGVHFFARDMVIRTARQEVACIRWNVGCH